MSATRSCPQCGAVVDVPAERLSGQCAFCRSPLVASDVAPGEVPDLVAPFVLTQSQAAERLRRHLQGRIWASGEVRRLPPERLEGVLVPFFVHDAVARSSYVAGVGEHYHVGSGKNRRRKTEWFQLEGSHVSERAGQLVSASRGMPEAEANALEPFDLGRARPFAPDLVAGWAAERPTLSREEALRTARAEIERIENEAIRRFLPGDTSRDVRNRTELSDVRVRLALLPAWIATFRSGHGALRLVVNGQTGEVVGKVPVSIAKILAVAAAVVLTAGLVAAAVVLAAS